METFLSIPLFELLAPMVNFFHMVTEFFSTNTYTFCEDFLKNSWTLIYEWTNILDGKTYTWHLYPNSFTNIIGGFVTVARTLMPNYLDSYPLYISILGGTMYWFFALCVFKFFRKVIFD